VWKSALNVRTFLSQHRTIHLHKADVIRACVEAQLPQPGGAQRLGYFFRCRLFPVRFDRGVLWHYLGIDCRPVYCTKIAAKMTRTFTDRHGLKDLCKEILGVELSKQQQSSDWGAEELTPEQQKYAANDVLYLHQLKAKLDHALAREGRVDLARACFDFLPARAELDRLGWADPDIFTH
jgi:ribonuclease D